MPKIECMLVILHQTTLIYNIVNFEVDWFEVLEINESHTGRFNATSD